MQALNITLFSWMGAGHTPNELILWLAAAIAENTDWACVGLMAWAAWRHPIHRIYILTTLAAAGVASLSAHALADLIAMPRPYMLGLSPAHIEHGARGALPSAHASVLFAVGLIFCLRRRLRTTGWAIVALAALTGWARVYVGVHFPFDIVAGLLLAGVVAAGFRLLDWLVARRILRGATRSDVSAGP